MKADYKVSLVRIAEIIYLESEGEYVRMHLADGSTITTLFRLKNMETALPAESFMRVHRSYIVNLRAIKAYVKGAHLPQRQRIYPPSERTTRRLSRPISTRISGICDPAATLRRNGERPRACTYSPSRSSQQ